MGTNYFVTLDTPEPCRCHCGHEHTHLTELHIGLSSCGWAFLLCIYPERGINNLDDWLPIFERCKIRDEYDNAVSKNEMLSCITCRERRFNKNTLWRLRHWPKREEYWKDGRSVEPPPNYVQDDEPTYDLTTETEFS